ncbi:MAG: S-methyl-5'-thioadenosine phosphorylase [Chloroflexi bacterium]|nr:S-methyl-5'-thioadenosine phosphorylase [Chloroflexota bacterium]
MSESPVLAVIGGSGLYDFAALTDKQTLDIDTPFGKPSTPIVIGSLSGKRVAFLARHGIGHHIMPHEINNRANIYALKSLGVTRILGISACGSLRLDYAPGHLIVPDQLVDFTRGRQNTFFGDGLVVHIGSADPFCKDLSAHTYRALAATSATVYDSGTLITIAGPRFSTKAESHLFRAWGMSIIGMTTSPEAFLAREAEICYATVAHVTDYDVWQSSEEPVNVEMVIRTMNTNTETIQQAIANLVKDLPEEHDCDCDQALEKAIITRPDRISPEARQKVSLLVDKYLAP